MVNLVKAIPFGIFLTIIVCLFMGSGGWDGGILNIRSFHMDLGDMNVKLYWSWAVFTGGSLLAFFIFLMMGD